MASQEREQRTSSNLKPGKHALLHSLSCTCACASDVPIAAGGAHVAPCFSLARFLTDLPCSGDLSLCVFSVIAAPGPTLF